MAKQIEIKKIIMTSNIWKLKDKLDKSHTRHILKSIKP